MKSIAIGVLVAGVAAWFGARDAQAQGINVTPTGPTAVYTSDWAYHYTATVTNAACYHFRMWVYVNGVQKHDTGSLLINGSNVAYTVNNVQNWNVQEGAEVKFKCRAWTTSSNSMFADWIKYAQNNYYGLKAAPLDSAPGAPAPAGLYAAAIRDEQEILA